MPHAAKYIRTPSSVPVRRRYRPSLGGVVLDLPWAFAPAVVLSLILAVGSSALCNPILPWMEPVFAIAWRGHSTEYYLAKKRERKRVLLVCEHGSVAMMYSTDCKDALYAEKASGDASMVSRIEAEALRYWNAR
jgi:hypothetical protein